MSQHGASTVEDGRRRIQAQQQAIAEIQRFMQEGFTLRREIAWYPTEKSEPQRCNPGGKYIARVSYVDDPVFYAPDTGGREVQVSGPPASSAFETLDYVADISINLPLDMSLFVGGYSAGIIQAETREGTRQFLSAITEARVQGVAGTNIISEIFGTASDIAEAISGGVIGVLEYMSSAASGSYTPGGIANVPVPSETVGHIRVYTEREGWFCEGSDMNDRNEWAWSKGWVWHHLYTLNYADYLTGKAAWDSWLQLRATDNDQAENYLRRRQTYNNSPLPPELRLRYFAHPWHAWADYHHLPITAPPRDVRRMSASERRQHYLY